MTISHAQSRCGEHPCCDASLSPHARADVLLAQLTLLEKPDLAYRAIATALANPELP